MNNKNYSLLGGICLFLALKTNNNNVFLNEINVNDNGFYVDFFSKEIISSHDFLKIEKTMKKISSQAKEIISINILDKSNDFDYLITSNNIFYNVNNINFWLDKNIKTNTKYLKFFILEQIGGVTKKINDKKIQFTRIYGNCFESKESLDKYLELKKDLQERDHRKIGNELSIFTFDNQIGQGLPIWLSNGSIIKERISAYLKKIFLDHGFQLLSTPILGSKLLYETSGHWELYKENNFPPFEVDNEIFMLRPMTCPHHMIVYNSSPKSYHDLPIKYCEDSKLHRYESSGGLIGLERVRSMELFDVHILCEQEQIEKIIFELNDLIKIVHSKLNIKIDRIDLSLRSSEKNKFINDDQMWEKSQNQLRNSLMKMKYDFYECEGEAAFYGPKIDFQYKTVLSKMITISTIQLDFLLPKRFKCTYKDKNNEDQTPVLIHFGIIGTYERFISALLSQTKGKIPFWLCPIQIIILPINQVHMNKCLEIFNLLKNNDFYVKIDDSDERLNKKIRKYQILKIPYMIIIGDKESSSKDLISYRKHGEENTNSLKINDFIQMLHNNEK